MNAKKMTQEMIEKTLLKNENAAQVVSSVRRRVMADNSFQEVANLAEPLAKSDYQISSYNDGALRLDFGPEVPESIKKKALDWAKRRNLKVKEASLEKSATSNSWILLVSQA